MMLVQRRRLLIEPQLLQLRHKIRLVGGSPHKRTTVPWKYAQHGDSECVGVFVAHGRAEVAGGQTGAHHG